MAENDKSSPKELATQRLAMIAEKYYMVFSSEVGKEILEQMKARAFMTRTTFGDNAPQHIRDAREGMRMFMIETEGLVEAHRTGKYKQPVQDVAQSETAEGVGDGR